MTGYLLDTNVLSEFARARHPDERVDRWVKGTPENLLFTSILTFAEIRRGIELMPVGKRRTQLENFVEEFEKTFANRLLPVTKAIGDRWAVLSVQAQRQGRTLSVMDGLIAATALEHDLTVVTRNAKDFAGLGFGVLDPWNS